MPSNISSNEGLWSSAMDLSLRKQRKSRGAPMKERLNNFSSDSEDVAQVPKQEETVTRKVATSQLSHSLALHDTATNSALPTPDSSPVSPPVVPGKQKSTLFSRVKKVPFNKVNSLDVFHFEGEGLAFKGKLIGIKDIDAARGDEMCQHAMQELKNALKQSKEHKARINISVSLSGLKIKDDKGTIVMHQHAIPKISYIWRDQTDARAFGYVYGAPDIGHRFVAIKIADRTADALVGAIHQLFQIAFRMKQHEVDLAKKGQDDTASNGSGDSKKENSAEVNDNRHHKVDEANLLDLESELFSISQGLEQINTMRNTEDTDNQRAWADFGADQSSSGGSSIGSTDPWGRGTPESQRIVTPDPFDVDIPFGQQLSFLATTARPAAALPVSFASSQQSWGAVPAAPPNSLFSPVAQSALSGFSVFDPPPSLPTQGVKKENKPMTDPLPTRPELFGEILDFGSPRLDKISNKDFPQAPKPKMGELRGEPTVIVPAPITVDPFYVSPLAMGLSVSISPPNQSSMMDFSNEMMVPSAQRRVSTTSGGSNSSPPVLPPRPMAHSNSASAFSGTTLAPPPTPRRSTAATPIPTAGGFTVGATSNPFNSMPSNHKATDPFADNFFTWR